MKDGSTCLFFMIIFFLSSLVEGLILSARIKMIPSIVFISILHLTQTKNIQKLDVRPNGTIFKEDQIVFSTTYNITKILVPVDGKFIQSTDIPSIFFTVADPKLEGGSCIYVLEGFAAYEVLEGGRDSTSDYGVDKRVYFGAKDGMYKYDSDSLSAKRYGVFKDDIIQIQKLNGTEAFYILTSDKKVYKIEDGGRNRTRVSSIICAIEFVLDASNNLYYLSCDDNLPHIILSNGKLKSLISQVVDEIRDIQLLRPAFVMEECIPFFGDGFLYILYSNGTYVKKDFSITERPSAFSVDAALYLVAALNGKIYEFNVMEVLLQSMFGMITQSPRDISKMVLSMMDSQKGTFYSYYV